MLDGKTVEVKNGETLNLGKHELTFVFAPMVHWPEVMVTYDSSDKVLFSADGLKILVHWMWKKTGIAKHVVIILELSENMVHRYRIF